MDQANILIIGGGVIGCAIAHAVSQKWQDVFLVEQNPRPGMATSTRNSGVIHSGIYYPKDSLKARLCVEGNRLMYEFCERHNVPHKHTGKLVVAANKHEEPELAALMKRGEDNGVEGLRIIDSAAIRAIEPHIRGNGRARSTFDGNRLRRRFGAHARAPRNRPRREHRDARESRRADAGQGTVHVDLEIGDEDSVQKETIEARCVVNAAGLYADEVAAMLGNKSWKIYPVRGEYCEIRGPRASLINSLVYPLPHAHGLSLGVHFTKTLWGTVLRRADRNVRRRQRQLRARPVADSSDSPRARKRCCPKSRKTIFSSAIQDFGRSSFRPKATASPIS